MDAPRSLAGWLPAAGARAGTALAALDRPRPARALLGAVSLVYVVLAAWLTRGTTEFVDEIAVFADARGLDVARLLEPLNGHLALFQRALYVLDWHVLGEEYAPLRAVEIGGVVLVAWLLAALLEPRVGPAAAALAASCLLLLGSAWELDVVVSGMGNVAALAFGLTALLLVERDSRRADAWCAAALLAAVLSFTLSLAFVAAVAVQLLVTRGGARRLWVVAPAAVTWVAWFAWVRLSWAPEHPSPESLVPANVLSLPQGVLESASATLGAALGLDHPFAGRSLFFQFDTSSSLAPAVLVALAVALALRLRRRPEVLDPATLGAATLAAAFFATLTLSYGELGRSPGTVRYVYAGSIVLVLLVALVLRGTRRSPWLLGLLVLVAATSIASNAVRLRDGMRIYRPASLALRATLTGLDVAGGSVRTGFVAAEGPLAILQRVPAAPYLRAAARYGSPGWSEAELVRRPEVERHVADDVLVKGEGLALRPAAADVRGCARLPPDRRQLVLTTPGARIVAPGATVRLRRFATAKLVALGAVGTAAELRLPADRSARRWVVDVGAGPGQRGICPLP